MQFNTIFYASPAVLVSVHHDYDGKVKNYIPPEYNMITAWVEVRHISVLNCMSINGSLFALFSPKLAGKNSKHSFLNSLYPAC